MPRQNKNKTILVSILALLAALPAGALSHAWAAEKAAQKINVRGGVHDNMNRLVVDWPRAVKYTLTRNGTEATLTFDAPADFSFNDSLKKLSRIGALSTSQDGGKTSLSFRVAQDAKLRDFTSGTFIVVDVAGSVAPAQAAPAEVKPEDKAETKVEPNKSTPPAPPVVNVKKKDDMPAPKSAPTVPVEAEKPTDAQSTAQALAEGQPIPAAIPAVSAPLEAQPVIPAPAVAMLLANVQGKAEQAVIYNRAGNDYMLFDKGVLGVTLVPGAPKLEPMKAQGFSIYRIAPPEGQGLNLIRADGKPTQILLDAVKETTGPGAAVTPEPGYSLGARVVVKTKGKPQIFSVTDPVVGDALYLVPLAAGEFIPFARHFVDFDLLESRQGLVIRPLNDKLTLRALDDGLEIALIGGLRLTDPLTLPTQAVKDEMPGEVKQFLELSQWRQPKRESFTDARQRLQNKLIAAPAETRDRARFDLARFYIANGYGQEAKALMDMIAQTSPDITSRAEFRVLMGVVKILTYDPQGGVDDLARNDLDEFIDLKLWRGAAFAQLRNFKDAAPMFDASAALLKQYQEPFYTRFSLLAAETYIATDQNAKAARIIDDMAERTNSAALQMPEILYLRGVLQSRMGTFENAKTFWEQASVSSNQLVHVRAQLALIDMGRADKTMAAGEQARQLEGLRYGWRGDELELEILMRLADAYVDANQADMAIDALDRAKRIFPDDKRNAALEVQQKKIFRDVFLTSAKENYQPLKTLSIYSRFKKYAPDDAVEHKAIVDQLVNRMLEIDLLTQAADLISQRMDETSDAQAKAKIGAQLAGVRLLNLEPEEALKALNGSDTQGLPLEVSDERKLLRARALSDIGKHQEALDQLKGMDGVIPIRLMATTSWRAKDWPSAAAALKRLLPPQTEAQNLTEEQAQIVMNTAIAYYLSNNHQGSAELRTIYGQGMSRLPLATTFNFVTNPDATLAGENGFAAIQTQAKGVDLFQTFLEGYRKQR